eukprot:CAMPEP_0173467416 /NCGR_PEP_ID=MMETSP1357-20121228/75014_1 /TAXON_ID=77926 /ORGANISM="Hemiselmis rufescens, Strain PCC563" /LENGTH=171 /DNA_ID=CAMNT_0014435549 /DNA_START=213 /DNA_END=724 /DNA_ORIENTATION=+
MFHGLAAVGMTEEVGRVLKANSSVVMCKDGGESTPLHYACMGNHKSTAETLLERNADPNAKDAHGQTPVHLAAMCGDESLVYLLLQSGGRPDCQTAAGSTPLHGCADRHVGVGRLLLSSGADPLATDGFKRTALHEASRKGNSENAGLFASWGMDPDSPDVFDMSPLVLCA